MKSKVFTITKAFALCSGFFVLLGLFSCRESNYLNPDLLPGIGSDNAVELGIDDVDAKFHVKVFDSLNTSNTASPYGGIGYIANDPFFGGLSSGMNIQFTIPQINYQFPDNMEQIDSVVLVIPYLQLLYGDSNSKAAFEVFEITDPTFKVDTSNNKFYAISNVTYNPTPIGAYEGDLRSLRTDSLSYPGNTDTFVNQLTIRLSNSIITKFNSMSASNTANNEAFTSFFRGLYIAPKLTAGADFNKALFYFQYYSLTSNSVLRGSRLEVYFRTSGTSTHGLVTFPYNNKYSAFYTKLQRNFMGTPAAPYFASNGNAMDSILITGGPGIYTELEINGLDTIRVNDIVNLARLEFNVKKTEDAEFYRFPPQVIISGVNDDGTEYLIPDYGTDPTLESSDGIRNQSSLAVAFVGGAPIDKLIDGVSYISYTLNFPRTIQQAIALGKDKIKIRMYPSSTLPGSYRLIAPGFGASGNERAKFKIIYSKL